MIHGLISLLYNGLLRGAGAAVLHASQPARDEKKKRKGKKNPTNVPWDERSLVKMLKPKKIKNLKEKNNTQSSLMEQNIDTAPPTLVKETTQLSNA